MTFWQKIYLTVALTLALAFILSTSAAIYCTITTQAVLAAKK